MLKSCKENWRKPVSSNTEKTRKSLGVVAVVPFWSHSQNLNLDSNYAYLRIVLPELSRLSPDTLWLMYFPSPESGKWHYTPDGLISEKIKLIKWPYQDGMMNSIRHFDVNRWREIERDFSPTVYWLHQVEMCSQLSGGGIDSNYADMSLPTLVAQHHYIIHKSLPYPLESQTPRRLLQTVGTIAADRVVFNSDHCRKMARESFGELLSASTLEEIERKSETLRFGLLTGSEPKAEIKEGARPVVIYNHRFESYKQPKVTFAQLDELKKRHKFETWVTQVKGQSTKAFKFDRVVFGATREAYLKNIAVAGVNTLNSVHETFCISALDSLAVGHLLVAPRRCTFPELVPADYPFLFENDREQLEMLDHIFSTWPREFHAWSSRLRSHALENFSLTTYSEKYLDLLESAESARYVTEPSEKLAASLDQACQSVMLGQTISLEELFRRRDALFVLRNQAFTRRRMIREAIKRGLSPVWRDGVCLTRRA